MASVAFGNRIFGAAGGGWTKQVWTSSDGATWTPRLHEHVYCVAYGNATFVALGPDGVRTSTDGKTWILQTSSSAPKGANAVTLGGGMFVAVGTSVTSPTIHTSADGKTWSVQEVPAGESGASRRLSSVAHGGGAFVAAGVGMILTSSDGKSWVSRVSGTLRDLHAIAHGNKTYVAVGSLGTILTSPNGKTWTDGTIHIVRGPANWPLIGYGMVLGIIQLVALGWLFARSSAHRPAAALIGLTLIVNRSAYVLRAVQHPLGMYLPSDVLIVGLAALYVSVALFGFRLLDPVTQGMQAAASQMSDGMIVIDPRGHVASINPAAEEMLGVSTRGALGRPVEKLLGARGTFQSKPLAVNEPVDMVVSTGQGVRQILMRTDLKDWRGVVSGRLLKLQDVTRERQAQAQVVEQQRALATLTERERLARELHDSLGQTLAAAHL